VKWTPGTENDDVVDQRGGGGGGGGFGMMHLGGGGLAIVAVVVVARLFGVDISGLLGGHQGGGASQTQGPRDDHQRPPAGTDREQNTVGFVKFVLKDIQDTFEKKFAEAHRPYRHAKLVLFRDNVDTACGASSKEIGPFYCPGDEHAYIDLSFYDELQHRFGAPGNFAEAYVLAHEIGHHLQKLFGERNGRSNDTSVRVELQADCFAGVWGHEAQHRKLLEEGDIERALTAASAIGDDRLQKQAGRRVNPESFTHGTSDQRMRWFRKGFDTGTFDACDTFRASSSRDL
jgi:predicted metalloprotease